MKAIDYTAACVAAAFHKNDKFIRLLLGPLGSGKSVSCVMEMLIRAIAQQPNDQGIRKTRWVAVRNSYRQLLDTTLKTFFDWIPEELGEFKKNDMTFLLKQELPDGTMVEAEFLFRALDTPKDVKKVLSLELTGAFVNEAREIPRAIIDALGGRVGRYPPRKDGGASWYGLILDSNLVDSDHWFYKIFIENCPPNHALFHQPSGLSSEAENIENLPPNYYSNMALGKSQAWVDIYVHSKWAFLAEGRSVYPEYKDEVHSTDEELIIDPLTTIYIGIDFGLDCSALMAQQSASGRWLVFDELVTQHGAKQFGELLNQKLHREYPNHKFEIYGDPAGKQRAQTDENTPFLILQAQGISVMPTYTNDPMLRREAVAATLTRMDSAGNTGFIIGPKAKVFRKAMGGGYCYKRVAVSGEERYMDKPDKNHFSHIADCGQYLFLGAGEGGKLISNESFNQPLDYSHSDRGIV